MNEALGTRFADALAPATKVARRGFKVDETFRQQTLDKCPRRYFWHYYRAHNGWEDGAPAAARTAWRLKKLTAYPLVRIGDILWTYNHPEVWLLLHVERGWSAADFERWLDEGGVFLALALVLVMFGLLVGPRFFAGANLELIARHAGKEVPLTIVVLRDRVMLHVAETPITVPPVAPTGNSTWNVRITCAMIARRRDRSIWKNRSCACRYP